MKINKVTLHQFLGAADRVLQYVVESHQFYGLFHQEALDLRAGHARHVDRPDDRQEHRAVRRFDAGRHLEIASALGAGIDDQEWAAACACATSSACALTLGAVKPTLSAPSLFTAVPRITARIGSPSASASSSRFRDRKSVV